MQTMKKSYSIDQNKIKRLCDLLCDNIEKVCHYLDIEYSINDKMLVMPCPIHQGDNPSALNIYHVGDNYRGNWVCRTHHCEKVFQPSIIGFMRGVLSAREMRWSKNGDQLYSFHKTLEQASKIIDTKLDNISVNYQNVEKNLFTKNINAMKPLEKSNTNLLSPEIVRSMLKIPCDYYLNRGYSDEILKKYDVGLCDNPQRSMYNRVVVPIYDTDHKHMIGCTGRSIYEACQNCGYHHCNQIECGNIETYKHTKWRHNKNFKAKDHLYNLWFAKGHIAKQQSVILVESPGNVWKLEQAGIHNSVAIFGTSFSDRQKMLLDCSGAMNVIIALDPDNAGIEGSKKIQEKCHRTYNTKIIENLPTDIGDMSIENIINVFKNIV